MKKKRLPHKDVHPSATAALDSRLRALLSGINLCDQGPQTTIMGVQHVIAMFGSTILAPILMGFDPNVAVLMSGIGTLIFFLITGGKVPSYLGSSFAFIAVVGTATGYAGGGVNAAIGVALGGIVICGLVYTLIGVAVHAIGTGWIERLMPPVVTGAIVAVIGLNLAGIPIKNMASNNFESWMQALTFVCVALVAVFTRGMVQRLLILVGLIVASVLYILLTNVYSTAIFLVAAVLAVLLGFSPKFGELIRAIPIPVMGGVSIVVFGLIAVAGARIWVENKVDFSQNKNLIVAAITLILGTGDFTLQFGDFALAGIGTATFGAIALYALLNKSR